MLEDDELNYLEIQDLINQQNYLLEMLNCEQPDQVREEIEYQIQELQDRINMLL